MSIYDIAIIGDGPAGLSAAINATARNAAYVIYGRGKESMAIFRAKRVENCLGMPGASGEAIAEAYYSHALLAGVSVGGGRVLSVTQTADGFALNVDNDIVTTRTVIFATGARKAAKLPGEDKFLGLGVSYCATCDAMIYRGKDVFIYGEGIEADDDAKLLGEVCGSVYYLPKTPPSISFGDNVKILTGTIEGVVGDEYVTGVLVDGEIINVACAFLIRENMPPENLLPGLRMEGSSIGVSRLMETNVPGVYAAGDCAGWPFQIDKAIGEGQIAAQNAARYAKVK